MGGYRNDGGSAIVQAVQGYANYKERQEQRSYDRDQRGQEKLRALDERNYQRGLTSKALTRQNRLDGQARDQREFTNGIASDRNDRQEDKFNIAKEDRNKRLGKESAIADARRDRSQQMLGEAQQDVSDAEQNIPLASDVQKLRYTNSKQTLVGGVMFQAGGEGKTSVGVKNEDGEFVNYTANPEDDSSAPLWISDNEMPQLQGHFSNLVNKLGSQFPELSKEQLFNAGFSSDEDGKVRVSTEDEFMEKATKLYPEAEEPESAGLKADKAELERMIDAGEGTGPFDEGQESRRATLTEKIRRQENPGAFRAETKATLKKDEKRFETMRQDGEGTKPWEIFDKVERDLIKKRITRSKSILMEGDNPAKVEVKTSTFDFKKDFPVLDKIREANVSNAGAAAMLPGATRKLLAAKSKVEKLASMSESYALGDPNVTAEMLQNVSETNDPTMSSADKKALGVESKFQAARLNNLNLKTMKLAKELQGGGELSEADLQKRNDAMHKNLGNIAGISIKRNGMSSEDYKDVTGSATMATFAAFEQLGMSPSEFVSAKGTVGIGTAMRLYAGNRGDFMSQSMLPALAAVMSGYTSKEEFGEFNDLMGQALSASQTRAKETNGKGETEAGVFRAIKAGNFTKAETKEFLEDLALGKV